MGHYQLCHSQLGLSPKVLEACSCRVHRSPRSAARDPAGAVGARSHRLGPDRDGKNRRVRCSASDSTARPVARAEPTARLRPGRNRDPRPYFTNCAPRSSSAARATASKGRVAAQGWTFWSRRRGGCSTCTRGMVRLDKVEILVLGGRTGCSTWASCPTCAHRPALPARAPDDAFPPASRRDRAALQAGCASPSRSRSASTARPPTP